MALAKEDSTQNLEKHLVRLATDDLENVSLDSVYLNDVNSDNLELTTLLSSSSNTESTPVSLYNGDKLIAKTAATFNNNKKASVSFTLPKNVGIIVTLLGMSQ